jgi:uncharacterized oxidoreductase
MANEFPELNVLVNNAGVRHDIDLTKGIDQFLAVENEIRVNLAAPIVLSALLIPLLVRNSRSALIKVSSALGFVPMAHSQSIVPARPGCTPFPWLCAFSSARSV